MYKSIKRLTAIFILASILLSCEKEEVPNKNVAIFKAELKGLNAIPLNTSIAKGSAILTYDNMSRKFTATTSYDGLEAVSGHIHMAKRGENGNVVFPFDTNNPIENVRKIEAQEVSEREHYEVVHNERMLFSLSVSTFSFSSPVTFHSEMLTDEQVAALFEGRLYVDFHTFAYPEGEIRGQLEEQ